VKTAKPQDKKLQKLKTRKTLIPQNLKTARTDDPCGFFW
jgi:hypothetical protein